MIRINWDPTRYLGPIPINWYGLNFLVAFVLSGLLVRKWAPRWEFSKTQIESLLAWILVGTIIGARIYFVVQNDFVDYLSHPWRIAALWEGGLAFFRLVQQAVAVEPVPLNRILHPEAEPKTKPQSVGAT
jgi:prolipoprotein diacylglyceryltransferase